MGYVYWLIILVVFFDLYVYFIIFLGFYNFLEALSGCRKLVYCGVSKDFNFFNKLYVRGVWGVGWST